MNLRTHVLVMLAAASVGAPALAADSYTIDGNHTMPVFEVNHLGFSTQRGRFNKVEGKASVDIPAKKLSVTVSIAASSIDMGLPKWDEAMQDEGFFFVERYPTIVFKAEHFNFEGDKPVSALGELTLLGQTHPVQVSIANFGCKPHPMFKRYVCGADLSTTIKRSTWGMVKHLPAVGDEVKILIPIEAIKDEKS